MNEAPLFCVAANSEINKKSQLMLMRRATAAGCPVYFSENSY